MDTAPEAEDTSVALVNRGDVDGDGSGKGGIVGERRDDGAGGEAAGGK